MDSKIVQVALNGLENILRLGEQEGKRSGSGVNPYCGLIEEAYGMCPLPNLTSASSSEPGDSKPLTYTFTREGVWGGRASALNARF